MRPKIVLLTLVAAFALLGAIALLRGIAGKNAAVGGGGQTVSESASGPLANASTNSPEFTGAMSSSGSPGVSEAMREAVINKELDEIQQLQDQVDGSNNLVIITAILAKLASPEPEVRQAALDALRQMNDTNAIPGLQQAEQTMTDPRDKVAVLDTIDYLKLPSLTENVPPDLTTNPDWKPRSTNRPSHLSYPRQRPLRQGSGAQQQDAPGAAAGQQQ